MPTIRPADSDDVPKLVRLINTAYEVEQFFVTGDRIDAEQVRRLMSSGVFLLADAEQALAASVYVELRGERGYFGLLAVAPSLQGTGWGRLMIAAAETHVRALGARAMDIRVVNLREELPAFYRKLGYEEAGKEPADDPRTIRPFHFVRFSKRL